MVNVILKTLLSPPSANEMSGKLSSTSVSAIEYVGLTRGPAVFEALVSNVLRDFMNHFVFVYLNDFHVFHVRT